MLGTEQHHRKTGYAVLSWIGVLLVPLDLSTIVRITSEQPDMANLWSLNGNLMLDLDEPDGSPKLESRLGAVAILLTAGGAGHRALSGASTSSRGSHEHRHEEQTRKSDEPRQTSKKKVSGPRGGDPVVISARRISMWYGQVIGINDVSLDIGPGVTGLLGPNGAGKSTLLKVLSGQLRPSTGGVAIFGQTGLGQPAVFSRDRPGARAGRLLREDVRAGVRDLPDPAAGLLEVEQASESPTRPSRRSA